MEIWSQACGTATTVNCRPGAAKGYLLRYYSREAANASVRPHLVVTYDATAAHVNWSRSPRRP